MHPEDRVRMRHMIDAAEAVGQFVDGRKLADLDTDRLLLFGVVRALEVIGEAASRVSSEGRSAAPLVPWGSIVGIRNRLVHGYFDINPEIVWSTATNEVPKLLAQLKQLVEQG